MTLRLALKIDGDATGAKVALDETVKGLTAAESAAERAAAAMGAGAERARDARGRFVSVGDAAAGAARGLDGIAANAGPAAGGLTRIGAAADGAAFGLERMSRAGGSASFRLQMLGFQLNDIGVQLASGAAPLTVLVQQGAQIAQIYGGQGGVSTALKDVGGALAGVVARFGPVLALAAAGAVAVHEMTDAINESTGAGVTMGDTFRAVFDVIGGAIYERIQPAVDYLRALFGDAWDRILEATIWAGDGIIKSVQITTFAIGELWDAATGAIVSLAASLPIQLSANWDAIRAEWFGLIADMEQAFANFLQRIASGASGLGFDDLAAAYGRYGDIVQRGAADNYATAARLSGSSAAGDAEAARLRGEALDAIGGAWGRIAARWDEIAASDPLGEFFDAVSGRAQEIAAGRAQEIGTGRVGSGAPAGGRARLVASSPSPERFSRPFPPDAAPDRSAERLSETFDALRGAASDLARALIDGEKPLRALSDTALRLSDRLIDVALDQLLQPGQGGGGPLSFLSGLFGGGGGGGAGGGPLSFLSSIFGGGGGTGGYATVGELDLALVTGGIYHSGGVAGAPTETRLMPARTFIGAPRLHQGGRLGPGEVPAILMEGEEVGWPDQFARKYGGRSVTNITMNVETPSPRAFLESRASVGRAANRMIGRLGRYG